MESFIKELYFGNINPQAKEFKRDSEYAKAMNVLAENESLLTKMLKDEELKLFLEFVNSYSSIMGIETTETFVQGFRLGASFTIDTFINKESEFKSIE